MAKSQYFLVIWLCVGAAHLFNVTNSSLDTIFPLWPSGTLPVDLVEMTGYAGYYLAGYYFSTFTLKNTTRRLIYGGALLSFLLTITGTLVFSLAANRPDSTLFDAFIPTTALATFGVFLFVQRRAASIREGSRLSAAITALAPKVFTIYLVHLLTWSWLVRSMGADFILSTVWLIPLLIIAVFLVSLLFATGALWLLARGRSALGRPRET